MPKHPFRLKKINLSNCTYVDLNKADLSSIETISRKKEQLIKTQLEVKQTKRKEQDKPQTNDGQQAGVPKKTPCFGIQAPLAAWLRKAGKKEI